MIENHQHTDYSHESIFKDEIVLENFYAGAGRGELLERMENAVKSGVPLMVLSGGEGSGKTTMCRMLVNKCPPAVTAVYFPGMVESFEDVVRIIARKLGLRVSDTDAGKMADAAILQIIIHLRQHSEKLLVIFDEAEEIYLATLERIRKMLDRITVAGVGIQVLFSGRKNILENIEQLSLCDFHNTDNRHFNLLPLTESETVEYLHNCTEHFNNPENKKAFSDEAMRNIHRLAKGRLRRINFLADESLRPLSDDTSLVLLSDNIEDEEEVDEDQGSSRLSRSMPYLWWIGGAVCTLVVLFLFFRPGEDRHGVKTVASMPAKVKTQPVAQLANGQQQSLPKAEAKVLPRQSIQEPGMATIKPETMEQKAAEEPKITPDKTTAPVVAEKNQESMEEHSAEPKPAVEKKLESASAPVKNQVVTPAPIKVPELRQVTPLKIKPRSSSESAVGTAKPQSRLDVQEYGGITAHATTDQIYQKRLHAGTLWAKGEKNDKFTIQLMVLTAENAELHLKKMLAQPNYRQEAGNFFIFKKKRVTEVVTVFYGEYPTMDKARIAQGTLPQFLRERQPYAISIKGAIAKVGK